jgi:replicative superfamily II helicase
VRGAGRCLVLCAVLLFVRSVGRSAEYSPQSRGTCQRAPTSPPNLHATQPAGSGKTLIAAEVVRRMLPGLAAQNKRAVFVAPTNPLVSQVRRFGVVLRGLGFGAF